MSLVFQMLELVKDARIDMFDLNKLKHLNKDRLYIMYGNIKTENKRKDKSKSSEKCSKMGSLPVLMDIFTNN